MTRTRWFAVGIAAVTLMLGVGLACKLLGWDDAGDALLAIVSFVLWGALFIVAAQLVAVLWAKGKPKSPCTCGTYYEQKGHHAPDCPLAR